MGSRRELFSIYPFLMKKIIRTALNSRKLGIYKKIFLCYPFFCRVRWEMSKAVGYIEKIVKSTLQERIVLF